MTGKVACTSISVRVFKPESLLWPLVISLLVACISARSLFNKFVSLDDPLYLFTKPASDGLTTQGICFAFSSVTDLYWHPLAWLSQELDIEWFGLNTVGHHLTSVVLHAITAGVLCILLKRIGANILVAGTTSLLWAIHPLRVESFAWIAERKDVLCALFYVLTILAYERYSRIKSPRAYAEWMLCGLLALMSKPTAISLPILLLLLDYWPLDRIGEWRIRIVEKIPLAAAAGGVLSLTLLGQIRSGSTSYMNDVAVVTRLANVMVAYSRYLGKILWPLHLGCFYPYDRFPASQIVLAATATFGIITIFTIHQRKARPWLLVGWAWFVITLIPNIGMVQAGRQALADRFTEIPMLGIVIALGWSISEWVAKHPPRQKLALAAGGTLLLALGALSVLQIGFWYDSITLYRHTISVQDSDYVRGNFAQFLAEDGRLEEAEQQLRVAVHLAPSHFEHHSNLANILLQMHRLEEADRQAKQAWSLAPDNPNVVATIGLILLEEGQSESAVSQLNSAVRLGAQPESIAGRLNDRGSRLASESHYQEAEPLIEAAVQLDPKQVKMRRNLALVSIDQGHREKARAVLEDAIKATGMVPEYRDLVEQLAIKRP